MLQILQVFFSLLDNIVKFHNRAMDVRKIELVQFQSLLTEEINHLVLLGVWKLMPENEA